ncbi:alpha/beta fold hydrolase [Streptomyces sp. ODS28]|uniref:alpha/beta fold hydrolase n=1 Tax=Streptomyces sp. ODS28 TaxID=3136688 RepID=UPI0031F00599
MTRHLPQSPQLAAVQTHFTVPTALGEVSVRVIGDGDGGWGGSGGAAVLLLHANPGDSRDFDAVLPALAREATVVTLDWPGFGGSTTTAPAQVTAEGLVTVAEEVVDALASRGLTRLSVLGNSVGGYVAARLARRRPAAVAGVILVDPGGFTPRNALTRFFCRTVMGRPRTARLLAAPLARAYLGRLRTSSARATYARAKRLRYERARLETHCALWRSFTEPSFDLGGGAGGQPCVPGTVPTLLIWGRRDPVVPDPVDGRRARAALPHATAVRLPTGHEPFNERPREFLGHVLPFLRARTATGGADRAAH